MERKPVHDFPFHLLIGEVRTIRNETKHPIHGKYPLNRKDMELWHADYADYAEYADFFCAESAKATPAAGAVPRAGPKGTHP